MAKTFKKLISVNLPMKCACLPQRTELVYVIPALRRELSLALKKDFSEKDIAMKLGLTKSAISQYINRKRASEIRFSKEMKGEIARSARSISSEKSTGNEELVRLLEIAKRTGCTCKICGECKK